MATTDRVVGAEDVAWDLGHLYASLDDPAYERDIDETLTAARAFHERYGGKIATLDAAGLAEAFDEVDRIMGMVWRVAWFPQLMFNAEATEEVGAAVQRVQEWATEVETELRFFELEWATVDDAHAEQLLADDALERHRAVLRARRRFRPHLLSEAEERVAAAKSTSGIDAWVRFYFELLSRIRVQLADGEVAFGEARSMLETVQNRDERRDISRAMREGLEHELRARTFAFNAVLHNRAVEDRLRGYPTWISAFNLTHQISDEAVGALVEAVTSRYEIARRHWRLRARLLGVERLATYDLFTQTTDVGLTPWDEAREIVLDAYGSFADEARDIVAEYFDKRLIDAAVRPGKTQGAFCTFPILDAPTYILLSYTGSRRSLTTLAHELGHGLHATLSTPRGFLNAFEVPLTMAETASVFGESLTYDYLRAREQDERVQLDLLVSQIDTFIRTAFSPIAGNRFEHATHTARREEGELTVARVNELWIEQQRNLYGDAVEGPEEQGTLWSSFPHFVGAPGYMYPYAFGVLLSYAIYRRWVEEGDAMVEPIFDLLRAGASEPPEELVRRVGFDLRDPELWNRSLDAVEALVAEAEALAGL